MSCDPCARVSRAADFSCKDFPVAPAFTQLTTRWHDRSKTCCDNKWEWNPPKGDCPKPKWCPKGWFWHMDYKKCKPQTPHTPEPDCDEWDEQNREWWMMSFGKLTFRMLPQWSY